MRKSRWRITRSGEVWRGERREWRRGECMRSRCLGRGERFNPNKQSN